MAENCGSFRIPVYSGLLTAEHRQRIGVALWEFLWCVNRVTEEHDSIGYVLGGRPVTFVEIGAELGLSERSVRRDVMALAANGYLLLDRTPRGFCLAVVNSRKFSESPGRSDRTHVSSHKGSDRTEVSGHETPVIGQKCPVRPDRSVRSHEAPPPPVPSLSPEHSTHDKESTSSLRTKKKSADKPPDPRINEIKQYWLAHYEKRFGEKPVIFPHAQCGQFLQVALKRDSKELIFAITEHFFSSEQKAHTWGFYQSTYDELKHALGAAVRGGPSIFDAPFEEWKRQQEADREAGNTGPT